jgi:hypothetical protein
VEVELQILARDRDAGLLCGRFESVVVGRGERPARPREGFERGEE